MQLTQAAIERYLMRLLAAPIQVQQVQTLGGSTGATALKALGYGQPLRIDFMRDGAMEQVVLHQITHNGFGRKRDADRVAEVWLNYATFNRLPRHVAALDRVALTAEGELEPAGQIQELLLLTRYAPGMVYADDLIRIRDEWVCHELDQDRASTLAAYLAEIHAVRHDDPLLWRRRLRDLVGHGEGIMGLTDSYPTDFALATSDDLRAIEEAAAHHVPDLDATFEAPLQPEAVVDTDQNTLEVSATVVLRQLEGFLGRKGVSPPNLTT